jgi:hypothetical protein
VQSKSSQKAFVPARHAASSPIWRISSFPRSSQVLKCFLVYETKRYSSRASSPCSSSQSLTFVTTKPRSFCKKHTYLGRKCRAGRSSKSPSYSSSYMSSVSVGSESVRSQICLDASEGDGADCAFVRRRDRIRALARCTCCAVSPRGGASSCSFLAVLG